MPVVISMDYLRTLTNAINGLTDAGKRAVEAQIRQIIASHGEGEPEDFVDEILEAIEPYIDTVAENAASLSAQSYDLIRYEATGSTLGARPYPDRNPEWTRKAVEGIAKRYPNNVEAFVHGILDRVDYEGKRAAGSTQFQNGRQDERAPRFARVPTGAETCPFCIMLASRGFVYRSAESAGKLDHYHPNCVTGNARVGGRGLMAVLRRKYEGVLVRVVTSRGDEFTVTPEHPVLTERGWVLADHLVEGDGLVRAPLDHGHEVGVPDVYDADPTAEEVFEAARLLASAIGHGVPATSEDFDTEAIADGDVEVVFIDRSLRDALEVAGLQPFEHQALASAGAMPVGPSFAAPCPLDKLLVGPHAATHRSMGGGCLGCPLGGRHLGSSNKSGGRGAAQLASGLGKPSADRGSANSIVLGEPEYARSVLVAFQDTFRHRNSLASCLDAISPEDPVELAFADSEGFADLGRLHAGEVEVDDVAVVERFIGDCHVYNFQTEGHWFTCNNIVTHNCDCRIVPQWGGESYEGYDPDEYLHQYEKLLDDGKLDPKKLSEASKHAKRRGKSATLRTRGPREAGGYRRISGEHTREDDVANANPNYKKSREWQVNCQRCVPTYLARRRGLDVVARRAVLDGEDDFKVNHWTEIYGGAHFSDFTDCGARTRKSQLRKVEDFMRSCGDNATAVVYIQWASGSAHVFVADRVDGRTTYCDPQSGRQSCKSYFQLAKTGKNAVAVLRIDDCEMPEDLLRECCEDRV